MDADPDIDAGSDPLADSDALESILIDLTDVDLNTVRSHPRNTFTNSIRRVLEHKNDINQYAAFDSVLGPDSLDRDE